MTTHRRCGLLVGLLLCTVVGCESDPPESVNAKPTDRYVPSSAQAEAALRTVLLDWQAGHEPRLVPDTSPAVHITDTFRKPDEKLVDFYILGEVPTDRPRCLAVDLRFEPERLERTRFTVVGIDPLWVFRLEDVELLAHWEHNANEPATLPGQVSAVADDTASEEPSAPVPPAHDEPHPAAGPADPPPIGDEEPVEPPA